MPLASRGGSLNLQHAMGSMCCIHVVHTQVTHCCSTGLQDVLPFGEAPNPVIAQVRLV